MTKLTWIILALPVFLIGCSSSGSSSSSKDALYRQIFKSESESSPAVGLVESAGEPSVIEEKEFNPSEYLVVTKSPDFFEYCKRDRCEGAQSVDYIDGLGVLVESTPTVNKYVYILGKIDYADQGLGGISNLPMGELTYNGSIEYYDPENDPNLENLNDSGTFVLTRTFHGTGGNSLTLDWNNDGTDDVTTDIEIPTDDRKDHDFTFSYDLSDSEKLIGHGTFHKSWQSVYGLFKSPNYAGGFKGDCDQNCQTGTN